MKIITYNVNGFRARYNDVKLLILEQNPDILCMQESKADYIQISGLLDDLSDYNYIVNNGDKGHHGVLTLIKKNISYKEETYNMESLLKHRLHKIELENFVLFNSYSVNSKLDLSGIMIRGLYDRKLLAELNKNRDKEIVLVGDLNVSPTKLDIVANNIPHYPGTTKEEINSFLKFDLIDVFREHYPKESIYSFKPYMGDMESRLDYFLCTKDIYPKVKNIKILTGYGSSDHFPVITEMRIENV